MEAINDDDIIGLVKGKIGEVMDRIDRERPKLSRKDREAVTIRIGQQEVALALVSRPDLAKRLGDIATEHFLRAIANEVRSVRSA
jgi:hypothetical protein